VASKPFPKRPFVNGNAGWTSGRKNRMNVELVLFYEEKR
jgi:hypothetical protein